MTHNNLIAKLVILSSCITLVLSCNQRQRSPRATQKNLNVPTMDRCVALRGNGTHAVAHIMSLARITTEWGEIQGIAGGSSATITSFLYESILLNPAVRETEGPARNEAIAMMLKSVIGYMNETMQSPEWSSLKIIGSLASKLSESGVSSLPENEYSKVAQDLRVVLSHEEIRGMVNPEIFGMLVNASSPAFNDHKTKVAEVKKSVASLTALDASDPDVFFRPGLLDFPHFVEIVGRISDFYAGFGVDRAGFSNLIKDCAPGTSDLLWPEIAAKKISGGTCGAKFGALVRAWRSSDDYRLGRRLKSTPGLALQSIMTTSVVQDPAALQKIFEYEKLYHQGVERKLGLSFGDVKFGYWVSKGFPSDVLDRWAAANPDGKSSKALSLGEARTWREILEKSPREPSLGKYVVFAPGEPAAGSISLGGWADLHPVQVLKAAGCGKVVYVTRRTPETTFISAGKPFEGRKPSGLAELLGMTAGDYDAIYNLDSKKSAFARALDEADGVWCTNWNHFSATEQDGIAMDAWRAPFLTKDPDLKRWRMAMRSPTSIVGCN